MAEGNVYIDGIDPSIPQWSTEATLQQIKNILSKENALTSNVSKQLDGVAKGEAAQLAMLRQTLGEQAKTNKATQELTDAVEKGTAQEMQSARQQSGVINNIKSYLMDSLRNDELQIKRQELQNNKLIEALEKKYVSEGMDKDEAQLLAKMEGARKHAETVGADGGLVQGFSDALNKLGQIGVAAEGINAFVGAGFEDRFNLANEIRQSGLMAGFDTVQAGMLNMADMVNKTGFTFGQAAEFTQKFAFAVGQRGVQASLEFADSMARPATEYEAGADMMRRFGMDFAQVANMSGIYLESLQNANMLGKLNDQQMRDGMDNFMEGVQSTSNILKVSLEEAAQMISQRMGRDDVTAMLALMDPEQRTQAQMGIQNIGISNDSTLAEALIKRISAGSDTDFARDDIFKELMSTGISSQLVPIINEIGGLIESGASAEEIQDRIAGLGIDFENIIANATDSDKALIQQSDFLQKLIADFSRMADNVQDANKGDIAETSTEKVLSDADTSVVGAQEIVREATVTIEGLMNTQIQAFKDVQEKLNVANDNAIDSMETLGTNSAGFAALMVTAAGEVQVQARNIGNAFLDATGAATGFFDKIVKKFNEVTGLDETSVGKKMIEATDGTLTDGGEQLETNKVEERAESKAMVSGRETLDDSTYFRFFDNDAEDMFDEIMSALTTANPGDMSSQANDLAKLLGFNDFNNTFDMNQESFVAAIEAIKETDAAQGAEAADRLQKLVEAIGLLDGEYKNRFFRSDETTANMNTENAQDRGKLEKKIEDLIDALRNPQ